MSSFSPEQLRQLGNKFQAAGWLPEDVTNLGQASIERLTEIRMSLVPKSDIVLAIENGGTELWLHPEQKNEWVQGRKILAHLTDNALLEGCVGVPELQAIQARGLAFFRKHFRGKAVFGWRGVGGGRVPCLFGVDGRVVLDWHWLDSDWDAVVPALRFAS